MKKRIKKIVEKVRPPKIVERVKSRKKKPTDKKVTDGSIEEHREEVLSKGRKFKYPIQYAKHKIIINTVLISLAAVIAFGVFVWVELYRVQSTGDMAYRLTKIFPLPVAEVDGRAVRYSDYLMIFRSSLLAVERQQGSLSDTEDGRILKNHFKRVALDDAITFTYVMKLAEEMDITISREAIDEISRTHRYVDGVEKSEENYLRILEENFGLTRSEYERLLRLSLTRVEVSVRIDENAKKVADMIKEELVEGDFEAIAEKHSGKVMYEYTGGFMDSMNLDGGRAEVAASLEVGQVSEKIVSKNGDGYYFVKLLAKNEAGQVSYESLLVPFTELGRRMQALRDGGRIREFITLER
jgi:hypothetical protein